MPKFYGRNTAIQVSVAELAKVTTQNPRPRQCPESTSSIGKIELEFTKASKEATLAEESLNGKDGRHLRFLGTNEDMPFFMVQAGKNFFNPDAMARRTRRPAKSLKQQTTDKVSVYDSDGDGIEKGLYKLLFLHSRLAAIVRPDKLLDGEIPTGQSDADYQKPVVPHALCLAVFLTKSSFLYNTYENGSKKTSKSDIKIIVYFNGHFVDSQIINNKLVNCTGSRGMKARIVRFTGLKLSRMIEKPWVFVPAGHVTNDTLSASPAHRRAECERASSRWTAISENLLVEAEQDIRGDRPISGDYLASLASVPIPSEVEDMQKAVGANFGVIDAVVIWGHGQKDGPDSTYISKPTRTRAERFPPELNIEAAGYHSQGRNQLSEPQHDEPIVATTTPEPHETTPYTTKPSASKAPNPIAKSRAEALTTATTLDGSSDQPPKSTHHLISELFPPARCRTPNSKRSLTPCASSQPSKATKRRRAMPYHHIITTKQTLSEELQSIAEHAFDNVQMGRTRVRCAEAGRREKEAADSSSPLSSIPSSSEEVSLVETPRERKIVKLRLSPEKVGNLAVEPPGRNIRTTSSSGSAPNFRSTSGASTTRSRAISASGQQEQTFSPSNRSSTRGVTTPVEKRKSISQPPQSTPSAETSAFDSDFVLPELSEDCCITYAKPGIVRNVGAVRGGWFEEKGVVMGVRFIVG